MKALKNVDQPYAELIKEFPSILKYKIRHSTENTIYHRIHTEGEPTKAKVRPLPAGTEKSEEGKKIWKEMQKMGVIERVQANTLTEFTSPLHMVKKPEGRGVSNRVSKGETRMLQGSSRRASSPA